MEMYQRMGSVKTALQLFGERTQRDDGGHVHGKNSETEQELSEARRVAEMLLLRIQESAARAEARKKELEALRVEGIGNVVELAGEVEEKKRELGNLRLGMEIMAREKMRAEEVTKTERARLRSSLKVVEKLGKEIQEADEEHVLVELARIEAIKEFRQIEAEREMDKSRYSEKLQESKARIAELRKEVSRGRKLEQKLAATTADVDVLQSEMMFVRAMEKKSTFKSTQKLVESGRRELQSSQAELEAARKELGSIKEEAFKYMASMDSIRGKLNHVRSESSRLTKLQEATDLRVQNLNSKLLQANFEVESASAAEKRRQAVLSDLSTRLTNLEAEKEQARKEREEATRETEDLRAGIWKKSSTIESLMEKLLAAAKELELLKSSEAAALDRLRVTCERVDKSRSGSSRRGSTIRIATFEYEYLKNAAAAAREIARKKVEAAMGWVEAFGSSEREVLLEVKWVQRITEELGEAEEKDGESQDGTESSAEPPRRSTKENGKIPNPRRLSLQRRRSLTLSGEGAAPIPLRRRRKKVLGNLAWLLAGKRLDSAA